MKLVKSFLKNVIFIFYLRFIYTNELFIMGNILSFSLNYLSYTLNLLTIYSFVFLTISSFYFMRYFLSKFSDDYNYQYNDYSLFNKQLYNADYINKNKQMIEKKMTRLETLIISDNLNICDIGLSDIYTATKKSYINSSIALIHSQNSYIVCVKTPCDTVIKTLYLKNACEQQANSELFEYITNLKLWNEADLQESHLIMLSEIQKNNIDFLRLIINNVDICIPSIEYLDIKHENILKNINYDTFHLLAENVYKKKPYFLFNEYIPTNAEIAFFIKKFKKNNNEEPNDGVKKVIAKYNEDIKLKVGLLYKNQKTLCYDTSQIIASFLSF